MTTATPASEWILAIDDDPWALEMTSVTLGEKGWDVQQASGGREAAEIISRLGSPSVILIDAMMPNEDGFSLCRRMRSIESLRNVPIVFVTALDDEHVRVQALEAGADDFLSKPVAPSLLVTRVRSLVELQRWRNSEDSRTRYGFVLDTIGEGVLTLDADDCVVEANRAAVALLGLPRDPLTKVHLPSHIAEHWKVVRGAIGRNHDARLVFQSSHGAAPTAVDWTSRSLPGDGEEIWTVVVRDATDLWERDQALGRMMKSLGHKLRTPLTGLVVGLEFARDLQTDPTAAEMVETAQESAQRLEDTIVRLLEFIDTAGESEALSFSHRAISPDELLEALGRHMPVRSTLTRPVRIELELADRAVQELVANAKAAGGSNIALHVSTHPDRLVYFEITDDGSGIPAAAADRVFEPFYQLDRSGEQAGTGLGLSILRADIERAGGSIGAWTLPAGGTTVWFCLPDQTEESPNSVPPTGVQISASAPSETVTEVSVTAFDSTALDLR